MAFRFQRLQIPDVILVEFQTLRDDRGFFRVTYQESEFLDNGIHHLFLQENYAHSVRGVLRGLHYQKNPQAQGKYLIVSDGRVFDVAVDMRQGSPTYGKWIGVELSEEKNLAIYVPPGFAHGYCVLSDKATIVYKVTTEYHPELERGIAWNDPEIGIAWPIREPILSDRDKALPLLKLADSNFEYKPG